MSRFLAAATQQFQKGLRFSRVLIHNTGQHLKAAKTPTANSRQAAPPPPKCPGAKRKPGTFASGGKHAVFNDCPMPEGDFMRAWHAKNTRYNIILITGALAAFGGWGMAISSGILGLNWSIPPYPYTEDEKEDFELEEERRREEREARQERHQDAVEARELAIRRRHAKEAMEREVELMQRDMDEGISDEELDELQRLAAEREAFEMWEKDEIKRLEDQQKDRELIRKEKAKVQAERDKERDRKRRERDAQLEKEEAEREKARKEARKEWEKAEKEAQKEKEKAEKEKAKLKKAQSG